jgi:hypothetical protein
LPNCWRPIFLVLPKLYRCQVGLPNCWSCSNDQSKSIGQKNGWAFWAIFVFKSFCINRRWKQLDARQSPIANPRFYCSVSCYGSSRDIGVKQIN